MNAAATSLPNRLRIQSWAGRSWQIAGGVNVRTKIMGIVLALTIVLGLGITWQVRTGYASPAASADSTLFMVSMKL